MDERSVLNPADSATNIDKLAADLSCDDDDQCKITLNFFLENALRRIFY